MDPSNKNIFSCFIMDLGKSPFLLFCFLFVRLCLLVWVCTVCKQVPEEAGVGAWNPGTVVPGSWKPRNMGAGNPTLVFWDISSVPKQPVSISLWVEKNLFTSTYICCCIKHLLKFHLIKCAILFLWFASIYPLQIHVLKVYSPVRQRWEVGTYGEGFRENAVIKKCSLSSTIGRAAPPPWAPNLPAPQSRTLWPPDLWGYIPFIITHADVLG